MRLVDYITVAFKDVIRTPIRSILTILALAISTTILITLTSISVNVRDVLRDHFGLDESLSTIVVTPSTSASGGIFSNNVQTVSPEAGKLDHGAVDKLKEISGVTNVIPISSVWEIKNFSVADYDKQFVASVNALDLSSLNSISTSAGSSLSQNGSENQVVIGQSYVDELGLKDKENDLIGKNITFVTYEGYSSSFNTPKIPTTAPIPPLPKQSTTEIVGTIVGVTNEHFFKNKLLISMSWGVAIKSGQPMSHATSLSDKNVGSQGYSSIFIETANVESVANVTSSITNLGYGVFSTQEQIKRLEQYTLITWLVLGSIALISTISACMGIANTMFMTISEERYVIGVWRASGARKSVIAFLFLCQALILGVCGGLLGTFVGYIVSIVVNNKIESALTTQGVPALSIADPSPEIIICAVLAATILSGASALFPAIKATNQDPSKALSSV